MLSTATKLIQLMYLLYSHPDDFLFTLRTKVQEEIARISHMECLNIIEKVTELADWVNSMVSNHKPNGKLQICIDP